MKRLLLSSVSVRPYIVIANQSEAGQAANMWAVHWLTDLARAMSAIPRR